MMTEEIAKSILDSGGAYGYNYEKNKKINLDNSPIITIEVDKNGIIVTKNIYHHLIENLNVTDKSKELNKRFIKFCNQSENGYWNDMNDFFDILKKENNIEVFQCYNTYNVDSCLSQILQYIWFKYENDYYVILQIHGGCDARSGYSKPYLFSCEYEFIIQDNIGLDIYKDNDKENMINLDSDDGGNHWYSNVIKGNIYIENVEGETFHNPKRIKINGEIYNINTRIYGKDWNKQNNKNNNIKV